MQTTLASGIKIFKGRNNRVFKGHRYHYMVRNSIFGIACGVDGHRMTNWFRTYTEASNAFRDSVNDITEEIEK
jgi:hypothetical protein